MSSPLAVRPLGPHIGAEVMDLNMADVAHPPTLQAIEDALVKHEALVLHVPDLTPDQHLAIANHFGEAEVHTCRVPCDYVPRRSWPLFKARAVLAGLLASLSLENKP